MKTGRRNIREGLEFEKFFDRPKGDFITIKKYGAETLADTIPLMKKVVAETLEDTVKIANYLQDKNVFLTCKRIWNFCFSHFQYERDEKQKEQIRRPARSFSDRKKIGIDCDDFTVFICSCLENLGIKSSMRLTMYGDETEYSHIYPVALTPEGEIIIDCVVHEFNYEVPYITKKVETMELQYLNGIEDENEFENSNQLSQ